VPDPLTRTLQQLLAIVALRCDCPLCDVHGLSKAWSELLFGPAPPSAREPG
jgi:hypothetical protein